MMQVIMFLAAAIMVCDASQTPQVVTQFTHNFKEQMTNNDMTPAFSYDGLTADECANVFTTFLDKFTDPVRSSAHDYIIQLIGKAVKNKFNSFTNDKIIDMYGNYVGNTILELDVLNDVNAQRLSNEFSNDVIKSLQELQGEDRSDPSKRIMKFFEGGAVFLKNHQAFDKGSVPVLGVLLAYEMYSA